MTAITLSSYSQELGTVRGFVYDKESGEPVIFTNVVIENSSTGAATDVNGFYTISQVPRGTYTVVVSSMGFKKESITITIHSNKIVNINFYLERSVQDLKTVTVVGEKKDQKIRTTVSELNITPVEINQLPNIGGQADIAQYLQVLPGVVFTGDRGGQLYIRGGSPVQNKVMLDGMTIFNPIHSIGLFSVFETDIMRNADIYTGGFNARYNNAISSVMDITTRDGNRNRLAGSFGASTFGAKFNLEGPVIRSETNGFGGATFIASVKKSYLTKSSQLFYKYVEEDGLPYDFLDIFGKFTLYGLNGSKLSLFGFHFDDEVDNYYQINNFNWKSYGGGMNFMIIPGSYPAYIHGYVAFSKYNAYFSDDIYEKRNSEVNNTSFGLDFTNYLGNDQIDYGFEIQGFKTYLSFINDGGIISDIPADYTTQLGFFIQYKKVWKRFIMEPGVRLQWYATKTYFSPEPRLAMKLILTDKLRIKASGGLYSQSIVSGKSDMDVVNLFNTYLTSITNYQREYQGETIDKTVQTAEHAIAGIEVDITDKLNLNVEGYYKDFSQLFNFNRFKVTDDDPDFIVETGNAKGIDFTMKYEDRNFYLWTVYSFSYVYRYFEGPDGNLIEYFPHYDRRHNLNILGSYKFGRARLWQIGMRWNLASGLPYTSTRGFYERINFDQGVETDYTITNGQVFVLLGELNGSRFPVYHRLDIDLKKKFNLHKNCYLEANISVSNVYNRKNLFYINRMTETKVYQLPVLPSIGVKLSF